MRVQAFEYTYLIFQETLTDQESCKNMSPLPNLNFLFYILYQIQKYPSGNHSFVQFGIVPLLAKIGVHPELQTSGVLEVFGGKGWLVSGARGLQVKEG